MRRFVGAVLIGTAFLLSAASASPTGGASGGAGQGDLDREPSSPALPTLARPDRSNPLRAVVPFMPVRIVIPNLGVDALVVPSSWLARAGGQEQSVPSDPAAVGWISAEEALVGADDGNVVLTGHNVEGAEGVFDNLSVLRPGDLVLLYNEQGEVRAGRVETPGPLSIAKVAFASVAEEIYYGSGPQRWVLVGCTGPLGGDGRTHRDSAYVFVTPHER